ncbi:hypothetical protein [Parachlamydia acanthamoebae]|uniref:hypothetical protein n=1 Tax=Parachlamydia acanthamoebae TaxID=83552 RepID=UPI000AD46488
MKDLLKHRHQLIGLAVALYLIPLFVLTFMSLQHLPLSKSWTFFICWPFFKPCWIFIPFVCFERVGRRFKALF